jgi:hypothetical protein
VNGSRPATLAAEVAALVAVTMEFVEMARELVQLALALEGSGILASIRPLGRSALRRTQ